MTVNLLVILAILLFIRSLAEQMFVRRPATGALVMLAIAASMRPDIVLPYVEPLATLAIMGVGFWFILYPFRRKGCDRHHCD